jgi:hypothetical protein
MAFVRIHNTFYMYKSSLDAMLQGSPAYYTAITTTTTTRSMMLLGGTDMTYYQGDPPRGSNLKNEYKDSSVMKKRVATYEEILNYYDIPTLFTVPQYNLLTAIQQEGFDPWMLQNDNEMHHRIHDQRGSYREQRQQRSRPPSIVPSETNDISPTIVETYAVVERRNVGNVTTIDIGSDMDHNATSSQRKWKYLCTKANLSKSSRVIITNALSVSIGAPLTLLLSKQCEVKNIMVVDAMFPNTKRRRLVLMNTFRTLFRNIATLQLTAPTNTAGLGRVGSEFATDWMEKFKPSHVLHLEDIDGMLDSEKNWGEYMSSKGQKLLHLQSSMLPIQQIMHYVHHKESTNELKVLHVTLSSSFQSDSSDAISPISDNRIVQLHKTSVTHDINAMMADYLYTVQHFRKSTIKEGNLLQMHHLNLPNVYGPIMNGKLNDRTKINDDGKALYLDDAMVGILKAIHVSDHEDRQIMTLHTSQESEATRMWRQDLTYAYEVNVEHPFGGLELEHYLSTITTSFDPKPYQTAMTWVDDLYGINKARFPCVSSCTDSNKNKDATACDTSVWDNVYPVSQLVTKECPNVLYYVNLNPKLDTLLGPDTGAPQKKDICRVAFVSGSSPLAVQTMLKAQETSKEKKLNDAETLQKYNGKLANNGWTLVWIPDKGASAQVSATDLSLLRIDPSGFFAATVQRAMFIESIDMMTISDDNVRSLLLSHTVHAAHTDEYQTTELRDGFDDVYRTIVHPPSNARSVTFLASALPADLMPGNPAQYVEQLSTRIVDNVKGRHLNYYKQMNHYIQVEMNRPVEDSDRSSPWMWISRNYFVHNFATEEARIFRCQWYDAHLYWGSENVIRDSEELSLAYLIAKQRLEGSIGYPVADDPTWFPQTSQYTGEPIFVDKTTQTEAFVRFMKQ